MRSNGATMGRPDPAIFTPEFDLEAFFKVCTCPFDLEMSGERGGSRHR
jgi:hypothetical protein